MMSNLSRTIFSILCLAVAGPLFSAGTGSFWLTADQAGQRLMKQERYLEAAETFEDPAWRGVAYYRGGDFDSAAAVLGRVRGAEAAFNRGNALLFLGRYEEAIDSYGQALEMRPGWPAAQQTLDIARARLDRLAPPEDDAGGTGGKLGADKIVFDDTGRVNKSGSEQETDGGARSKCHGRVTFFPS